MGVTSGGEHLEDAVVNGEEGDIEGSTTEIIDDDLRFTTLLVETVGDSGGGGFVDDTEDLKTGDCAGVLGSLTLGVVEVCGQKMRQLEKRKCGGDGVQAGTVTTAWVTFLPRYASAVSFILVKTIAEISSGV